MINETYIDHVLMENGFTDILSEQFEPGGEGYEKGAYEGAARRGDLHISFVVEPDSAEIHLSNDSADPTIIQGPILHLFNQHGRGHEETFVALINLANKLNFWSVPLDS
jgi:hypothetical protein